MEEQIEKNITSDDHEWLLKFRRKQNTGVFLLIIGIIISFSGIGVIIGFPLMFIGSLMMKGNKKEREKLATLNKILKKRQK